MTNLNKKYPYLDLLGLCSIGILSLGYVVFGSKFAEQHIQLPFLDFPIFVGEMLLFVCLLLWWAKYRHNPPKLSHWHWVIICYFGFVIIKALYGYFRWGPLALRHAALLYYPVFAIFGYSFLRRDLFGRDRCLALLLIIATVFFVKHSEYWILTLVFLGITLIRSFPYNRMRSLLSIAFFIIIPYKEFFFTSRMMILSNFLSGLYLAGTLPIVLNFKRKIKFVMMMLMLGVVVLGLYKFADHDAVKSIVAFRRMTEVIKVCDAYMAANEDHFRMEERKEVKLYNPNQSSGRDVPQMRDDLKMMKIKEEKTKVELKKVIIEDVKEKIAGFSSGQTDTDTQKEVKQEIVAMLDRQLSEQTRGDESVKKGAGLPAPKAQEGDTDEGKAIIRETFFKQVKQEIRMASVDGKLNNEKQQYANDVINDVKKEMQKTFTEQVKQSTPAAPVKESKSGWADNNNAVFRILIWRDMWRDLIREKPVLGFSFGRPLRSKSLEMLHWGDGDWARDGWIEPHNSYWHIIYRMGVVGVLLIFGLLIILFRMIMRFIQIRSVTGLLLCAILIDWFLAANFLVIFELPYTAIPIWTIFGMTFAYCYKTGEID